MNFPQLMIVIDMLIYKRIKLFNYNLKSDQLNSLHAGLFCLIFFCRLPIHVFFQLKIFLVISPEYQRALIQIRPEQNVQKACIRIDSSKLILLQIFQNII